MLHLALHLMPYLYTCVRDCHVRALPLLRPMCLSNPREERAYAVPGQYMLGDDLLVAPIVAPGIGDRCIAARRVWFPCDAEGSRWHNLFTGERHDPGEEAIVAAPIDQTPLYIRAGVLVPMQPATHRMTGAPARTLVLACFPGEPGEPFKSTLYEDDGLTLAHERAGFATTALVARWLCSDPRSGELTLLASIGPARGGYEGQPAERAVELRIGGVHRVLECHADRNAVAFEHEPVELGGRCVVALPAADIGQARSLRVRFEPTDARPALHRNRLANLEAAIGEEIGTSHLLDAVLAHCTAGPTDPASTLRRAELLAIGAGIGAVFEGDSVRFVDSLGWVDGGSVDAEIVERIGASETVRERRTLQLDPTAPHARAGSIPVDGSDPKDSPVGLRASRIARFRFAVHGKPMLVECIARTTLTPMSHFAIAGPFAWDWRNAIVEAAEQPERSPVDPIATFTGRDGKRFGWALAAPGPKWPIDARASLYERGGLAYAATTIVSPRAQSAQLHLTCGDKLEAFVNGAKVITLDDHSAHGAPSPIARIVLRAGANELLIKFTDGGGGWGFSASIEGDEPLDHVSIV